MMKLPQLNRFSSISAISSVSDDRSPLDQGWDVIPTHLSKFPLRPSPESPWSQS